MNSCLQSIKEGHLPSATGGCSLHASTVGAWQAPLLGIVVAALWPVWRWYGSRVNDGSDEPLGLLALAAVLALIAPQFRKLAAHATALWTATVLLIAYAIAGDLLPPLLRALLAVIAVGLAAGLGRAPAGVWGLLCLSLPLMASLQFYFNYPLQKATAHSAAFLLNAFPVNITVSGTLLMWQGAPVAVDPPCSGIKMLWVGGFAHFVLATRHRLGWRTLAWLSPLALLAIIGANALRAALLFPKESGAIPLPAWTHAGAGLVVFGGVLALMTWSYARLARPLTEICPPTRPDSTSTPARAALLVAAALAAISPLLATDQLNAAQVRPSEHVFPGWPDEFEGRALIARPLSSQEKAFAASFPGRLGVFDDSDGRRIILRWITQATRKLHSSADCLRATGCEIEALSPSDGWRRFLARSEAGSMSVRERIHSQHQPGQAWRDVSAWFWAAVRSPQAGPWWAVTVIEARQAP